MNKQYRPIIIYIAIVLLLLVLAVGFNMLARLAWLSSPGSHRINAPRPAPTAPVQERTESELPGHSLLGQIIPITWILPFESVKAK